MRYCWLCRKKVEKGNGTFFNVPKDEGRRDKWGELCGIKFTPNARICIDHFSPLDIISSGNKSLLLPKAMPIMQHQQTEEAAIFPKSNAWKDETISIQHVQPLQQHEIVPGLSNSYISSLQFPCPMETKTTFDSTKPSRVNGVFFTVEELTTSASPKLKNDLCKDQETQTDPSIFDMESREYKDKIRQLESENKDLRCELTKANLAIDCMRGRGPGLKKILEATDFL